VPVKFPSKIAAIFDNCRASFAITNNEQLPNASVCKPAECARNSSPETVSNVLAIRRAFAAAGFAPREQFRACRENRIHPLCQMFLDALRKQRAHRGGGEFLSHGVDERIRFCAGHNTTRPGFVQN